MIHLHIHTGLIHYTELWQQPEEHGKYTLQLFNPHRYMRLDAAALRALHVIGDGSSTFSLYALLNKAKTPMGKRLIKVCVVCCLSFQMVVVTKLPNTRHG